jgi:hypothetical protein
MAVLYATIADLIAVLQGTDSGIGTPATLSPQQLTLALMSASTRVSISFGSIMDSSVPQAVPPDSFHDLTLDLAAFYAWRTYLKGKAMPADHPAFLVYKDAIALLAEVRKGSLRLDPAAAGGINQETGVVINRIPNVFTGDDSNTIVDGSGTLQADTPPGYWMPGGLLGGGVQQG